jgi:hypothetical protein
VLATLPLPLLFGLLAQAEPAPAEMPPPAGAALVAEPAPATEPIPAPALRPTAKPEQSANTTPPPASPFKVGFRAGADFQLSGDVPPKVGFSFSPFIQYEVTRIAERLGLGVRAQFLFDRFQKQDVAPTGPGKPLKRSRSLSFFDFSLLGTATLQLGPLQPWAGVGAGLAIGYFSTPEDAYQPGDARTTRPLAVGAFGIDITVKHGVQLGLHGEYRGMLAKPDYLLYSGEIIKPFGDRLSVQAAILYQF